MKLKAKEKEECSWSWFLFIFIVIWQRKYIAPTSKILLTEITRKIDNTYNCKGREYKQFHHPENKLQVANEIKLTELNTK